MAELEYCKTERDGPILIVTLNRPEVMNALHPMANQELSGVFDAFAADPDQWVAIITGAGDRAFRAGNDLKFQASGGRGRVEMPATGLCGIPSLLRSRKPQIAAMVRAFARDTETPIVLVSHDEHDAGLLADERWVLVAGRLTADGTST